MRLRDRAMHEAGVGHMHRMRSVVTGIFLPMWRVRADTLPEKVNIRRGQIWSRPFFWEDLARDDLTARLTRFERPVYFFTGRQDYTANAEPSRAAPLSVSLSRPTSSHMGRSVWCPALV